MSGTPDFPIPLDNWNDYFKWPRNIHALRRLSKKPEFRPAFPVVAHTKLVDPPKFWEIVRAHADDKEDAEAA